MHRKLAWFLLAAAAIVTVWQAAKISFLGSSSEGIQQTRHDSVRRIVHPQPSEQAQPSNLQQSHTSHSSNTLDKLSDDYIGIPRQPTVDVFLLSASRNGERDLLIRYIDGLKRRYEIIRLFRSDTVIVDSTARLTSILEQWFTTAPTAPVQRYRNLFNPIESYCRTDVPIHAIIAGTMSASAGEMIADLRCLRHRRNVSFTLALRHNLSFKVWKRALEDLAIPYHTIP